METNGNSTKEMVPEHLQDLYRRTIEGLNKEQGQQVARLLINYGDIFSKNYAELGRIGIIKHKIPTGQTPPIKQPPRCVPVNINDEVDK